MFGVVCGLMNISASACAPAASSNDETDDALTVGINELTCSEPLYYAAADVLRHWYLPARFLRSSEQLGWYREAGNTACVRSASAEP